MIDPAAYATVEGASAPVFSVDGRTLFHLRGSGLAQVWALDLASGAARALTSHDEKVGLVRRAPDDDRLVYAIDAGGDERHQLWLWEDGGSRALTAAPEVMHGFGAWSPDGARISCTANDRDEAHFDLVVMELATGVRTRLAEGVHEAVAGPWSQDGRRLLLVQERSTGDQRPFVATLDGEVAAVPRAGARRFASLRWDGDELLGLVEVDGWMALCRVGPESGAVAPEYAVVGRDVQAWSLSGDGVLATVENDRGYSVLRVGPRGAGGGWSRCRRGCWRTWRGVRTGGWRLR